MGKTKWYTKPLYVLLALALVLSLGIAAVPMAGTVEADGGNTLEVSKWTEYSDNPIFGQGLDSGPKAYYPSVVKVSDTDYRMWYGSDSGVGYATSPDGLSWAEEVNPVSGLTSANHPLVEYYADGFTGCNSGANPSSDTMYYRIWYWDTGQLYSVAAIRYAESPDGTAWSNDQPIQNGAVPIISGGDPWWNRGSYGPCDVLYNPSASNTDTDWTFTMYYDGTTGGDEAIGLGFSSDGITWIGYDADSDGKADPVLTGSGSGWDTNYVSRCTVLEVDDVYHMWFSGGTGEMNAGIGYATSSDGLTWTKDANNPILYKDDGVSWRDERTYTPTVIEDGGIYKMWFSGKDTEGNYAIGYATADGPFPSIQSAVDAADPEDTINVAAGTYQEAITIDKSLTLMAASKPVIDCSDRVALGLALTDGYGCIEVTADDVIIQGFKLIGYDPTGESWSDQKSSSNFSTIKVTNNADGLKVKDNEFTGTSKAAVGLLVDEDSDDVEFTGNTVTDYLQGVAGHKSVDNLLVEGNTFDIPIAENTGLAHDEAYGYGVQLWHGNNLQVINNTFTGSWNTATGDYEDPDALCNHYAVSTFTTYFASAFGWPDIVGDIHTKDNEMTNLYLGVGSFAGGGEIEDNNIHNNLLGIQLGQVSGTWATAPTAGLSITGNDIESNKRGIWVQDIVIDGIAAHFNNIVGNTEYGIINEDPENDIFDATYNWWGSINGPTHAGNTFNVGEQGDAVSDYVDYVPWYDTDMTGSTFAPVENTSTGEQFSSIQAAIDDADTLGGHTINVVVGNYDGFTVPTGKDNLTVQGTDLPLIDGAPGWTSGGQEAMVRIEADGVTIDGFEIDGTDETNNHGIYPYNCDNGVIKNNVVHDIYCDDDKTYGVGIQVFGWDQGMSGFTIQGNTVYNTNRMGIIVSGMKAADYTFLLCPNNTIKNNTVYDVWKGTNEDNGGGIQICSAKNCMIEGNTIYNVVTSTEDNRRGIYISGSVANSNDIKDNKIHECDIGIGLWTDCPSTTANFGGESIGSPNVEFNNIYDNTVYGLSEISTTYTVDAMYNWWGDASGPSGVGPGTGDAVSDYVDYAPWITALDSADVTGADPSQVDLQDEDGNTIADVDISGAPSQASGTITAFRYTTEPAPDGISLVAGTGKTGVVFVDVYVTGYTSGTAHITVPYTLPGGIVEDTLGLYYWDDVASMWRIAHNSQVDTVANTVSGDIPVSALGGTPIGIGGYPDDEATVAIKSIINLSFSGNDTVDLTITTKAARLGAATIDLIFDNTVVQVLGGENSQFDSLTVNPLFGTQTARFVANQLGATGVDATGGAVLAQVRLKAVGTTGSSSPLTLDVITLKDNDGISIPYVTPPTHGTATIGGLGDANSDGAVDVYDCVFIARAIAKIPGYIVNDDTMDVDGEDDVDAFDCTYLARHIAGIPGYELGG